MNARTMIVWMFMGVLAAVGLYMVKYRVQTLKAEAAQVEAQLREEKKSLHVLSAEWTYLNRPERLRVLAAKYLSVKPVRGAQLGDFATLPISVAMIAPPKKAGPVSLAKGMTLASGPLHGR